MKQNVELKIGQVARVLHDRPNDSSLGQNDLVIIREIRRVNVYEVEDFQHEMWWITGDHLEPATYLFVPLTSQECYIYETLYEVEDPIPFGTTVEYKMSGKWNSNSIFVGYLTNEDGSSYAAITYNSYIHAKQLHNVRLPQKENEMDTEQPVRKPLYKAGQKMEVLEDNPITADLRKGDIVRIIEVSEGKRLGYACAVPSDEPIYRVRNNGHDWEVQESAMKPREEEKVEKKPLRFKVGDRVKATDVTDNIWRSCTVNMVDEYCKNCFIYYVKFDGTENCLWINEENALRIDEPVPEGHRDIFKERFGEKNMGSKSVTLGLIPDPIPQFDGARVLRGTGHWFANIVPVRLCFDKKPDDGGVIIGYGDEYYENNVWGHSERLYLPDNLGNRLSIMSFENLKAIESRLYEQFPHDGCVGCNCRRCNEKPMPGSRFCYEHDVEKKVEEEKKAESKRIHAEIDRKHAEIDLKYRMALEEEKERRRQRRAQKIRTAKRLLIVGALIASFAFAAVNFRNGKARNWTKATAHSIGHFLQNVGQSK